jgi:hypothetical protein
MGFLRGANRSWAGPRAAGHMVAASVWVVKAVGKES